MRKPSLGFLFSTVTVLLVASAQAPAAEVWHVAKIGWIYPHGDGQQFILIFQTDAPSCLAAAPKRHSVTVGQNGVTAEGLKQLLAASLSAAAQGLTVQVAFDNGSDACYVNRLVVVYT